MSRQNGRRSGAKKAERHFQIVKKKDEIKTEWCRSRNISLLKIPFWENIEEKIDDFLKVVYGG